MSYSSNVYFMQYLYVFCKHFYHQQYKSGPDRWNNQFCAQRELSITFTEVVLIHCKYTYTETNQYI